MKRNLIAYLFLSLFAFWQHAAAAPIPYSGKVAINGANFQGDGSTTNRNPPEKTNDLILTVEQPYVAETAADVTDP